MLLVLNLGNVDPKSTYLRAGNLESYFKGLGSNDFW